MSFNANDNNPASISRTNYEEYFLLYADSELNDQDRAAVETFVQAHPDLQAELDLFLSVRLTAEDFTFQDKEALLAESMKLNAIDESLLLYLDNELNESAKKLVEEKLATDKAFKLQYHALLKTKLEPRQIAYPSREELYHGKEKRRVLVSTYWLRIAVAIIILLGVGISWFNYRPTSTDGVAIAPVNSGEGKKTAAAKSSNAEVPTGSETQSVKPVIEKDRTGVAADVIHGVEKKSIEKENKIEPKEERSRFAGQQNNTVKTIEEKKPQVEIADASKNNATPDYAPAIVQQQTVNNKNVTSPPIASLNDQTTDAVTAVHATVIEEQSEEKKSKLKGILRKATRFIERRTNISTTNENNQLVIGAVAIQL
jgi:hypothetical protein